MKCPRCQSENPGGMKFCGECAALLASICAACGASNPPENKFCGQCAAPLQAPSAPKFAAPEAYTPKHLAERILTSKSAIEGERKQVTVLFADLKGSMELLADRDPEEARGLLDPVLERMMEAVHHYEGTVNQVMGDGIMALFGAPVTHEDHAVRGCYAALRMQESVRRYADDVRRSHGVEIQIRVGLNSGEVVVRSIGSDLRMDYTAVGQTTHLAARMEQLATPGAIRLTAATLRLAEGYVQVKSLGPIPVKGLAEPVEVYDVTGVGPIRTRIQAAAARGLTGFVGRDAELRLLRERFDQARAGQGQVVSIVGEPGIGKSRLLIEFRRQVADRATWVEGQALSFGRSMPLHPLIDLLRQTFRLEEGDSEATIIEKVDQHVSRLGQDVRPALPFLRHLLSVDPGDPALLTMDPKLRRAEVFDALRRLFVRGAELDPLVVLFEDIHWADQETEDWLALMADGMATQQILLILTYRPGHTPPLRDRAFHTRLALTTLSTVDSIQMARAVFAAEDLPEELERLITRKTEGNPFFVEEVARSLQEAGAVQRAGHHVVLAKRPEEIAVPDTIHDVILSRIDRLADAPKRTLQIASVIGREFSRRLLDRLGGPDERVEPVLRELMTIELIHEKSLFPEPVYMFQHALTQQVAYSSLMAQRRKELHRLVGVAIEALYADRLGERYDVLAHHFAKAEEWPQALAYLLKAADKASQAFAIREALALYDQALGAASRQEPVDPAAIMAIHQAKSALYFLVSDFERSRAEAERLLEVARQAGDRAREATALAAIGWAATWARDLDGAIAYARRTIEASEPGAATAALARSYFTIGWVHAVTGGLREAGIAVDRALAISRSAPDVSYHALSLTTAGLLKNWEGEYAEASRLQAEGLAIAREHNLLAPLLFGFFLYGMTLTGRGAYDDALALLEEGLTVAERIGDEAIHHRLLNCLGWLHMELGDLDRATVLNERSAEVGRRRNDPGTLPNAELNLGDIFMAKGDLAQAHDRFELVHHLARDPAQGEWMKWRYSIRLFASLGELWLARGDSAMALDYADQCLELATRTGARKNLVKGWRLKAEIALGRHQLDDAERALREALAVAQAIGNPTQLWKTHVAVGRLHEEKRNVESARQAYQAARDVIDGVHANLRTPALRASFERSPAIRAVHDPGTPR